MASSKASRQTLLGALGFQNSRAETSATSSSGAFDLALRRLPAEAFRLGQPRAVGSLPIVTRASEPLMPANTRIP
jgi:hypothetical protein